MATTMIKKISNVMFRDMIYRNHVAICYINHFTKESISKEIHLNFETWIFLFYYIFEVRKLQTFRNCGRVLT